MTTTLTTAPRPAVDDLVDVATGDVVLAETDVTLPGLLPLVVERTHRSSTRSGRWFGRSWTSTLDQRLRVTGDAVCVRFAGGEALTWTAPGRPGDPPAVPVTGPAWPMWQDPDGSYAVSDPHRGLIWRFERRAGYDDGEQPLISVTDRTGHEIVLSYDGAGRPLGVVHSGGYRVVVSVVDGHVTGLALAGRDGEDDTTLCRYTYDGSGDLTGVADSSGLPRRYAYDGDGRLTGRTDRNGCSYHYTYDAAGRCVRGESTSGVLSGTFAYEPGVTRWTTADGAVTSYETTGSARVTATTDSIGKTVRTEFDGRGRVTVRTDAVGRVERYGYDDRGHLVSVTRPDGSGSRVEFDDAGLPVRVTGPDGGVWLQAFDKFGNLTEQTAPDGSVRRNTYDSSGHLVEVTGADGTVTTFDRDPAGLAVAVTTPAGETTRFERDRFGRVVRAVGPDGTTAYAWTTEGRPVSRTRPDGSTESWAWDGEGNLLRRVSATGSVTSYTYGQFGRLMSVTWPDGTRSELTYNGDRGLTSVTHGGLRWRYERDSAGRLSAQTDYNRATFQYWYNAARQLVHRVNPSGHEASMRFDQLGDLVSYDTADGGATTFEHDPAGRLVRARNDDADLVIVRDPLGRVVSETCDGRTVTTTYDAAGKVTGRVTPSGAVTAWAYDAAGMPATLTADGRELRFDHDPAGREIRRELPGGSVLTQEWDRLGRLAAQTVTGPAGGPPLQRRAYTYDPDGLVTGSQDLLAGDRTFHRDAAGRVTAVTGRDEGWSERYDYDLVGNIVHATWPAAGSPGTSAQETSAQGPRETDGTFTVRAGDIRYRHDATGRVVLRTRTPESGDPESWRYTWDADSRLYSVTLPDGSRWRYHYDPLGRRTGKQHLSAAGEPLEQTRFVWAGTVLVEQEDLHGDHATVTTWSHGHGSRVPLTQAVRTVTGTVLADGEFHALVTDVDGTPTELVAPDGTVVGGEQRTLWGLPSGPPGPATTPLRRPGRYHDRETGLHYDDHRYYDPETGTYLSPDLRGLTVAANPHAAVPESPAAGDPLRLVDGDDPAPGGGWLGSLLLSSGYLPVFPDVDGFDARLYAGGPGRGGMRVW